MTLDQQKEVEERYRNGEPLILSKKGKCDWSYWNYPYDDRSDFKFNWDMFDYKIIREEEIVCFKHAFLFELKKEDKGKDKMVKTENNLQKVNKKIEEIYEGMKDLNIYKNTQYGNIGSEPLNLFAKYMSKETPALNGIYQRLDDKLSRVKNCPDERPRVNDVCDIMGYLNLLLVNMGVTKEDIEKFKD